MSSELKLIDWTPNEGQRVAKARFYAATANAFRSVEAYSREEVARLSGNPRVTKWLQNEDFTLWFYNADVAKQKILAHAETAVDELVGVLQSTNMDPKQGGTTAASKVRAAEIILQYAGLTPPKKVEQTTKLDAMSNLPPEQLKEFLGANVRRLLRQMSPDQVREIIGTDQLARVMSEGPEGIHKDVDTEGTRDSD